VDHRGPLAVLHLELQGLMVVGAAIPVLLVLTLIVLVVVIAVQRSMGKGEDKGDGADIISYLLLALAMGVAGFALAALASTAFPGESLVFDPADSLATSLSALVVSSPFLVYFWQRQLRRRAVYPDSTGWALYLSVIEIVFLTAFVTSAVAFMSGLLNGDTALAWTGALIFGAIVVFHEYAAHATPPQSDAAELRRVVGSAIGLITATIGATGVLAGLLASLYEVVADSVPTDPGFDPWLAMLLVGGPIWWYRWLRPWGADPALPRLTWSVLVAVATLATAVGAATGIGVQVIEYLFTETVPAGQHFDSLPLTLALVATGVPIWMAHRRILDQVGGNALRVYRYIMAAIGLVAAVSMAIALTIVTFDRSLIVGAAARDIITLAVVLVIGLIVWLVFERRSTASEEATASWPRRLYTLGFGIAFGLVAAGALITALFIVLRTILGDSGAGGLLEAVTVFGYAAAAAWYLLQHHARDRVPPTEGRVAPFDITVICSHPGPLATKFPDEARLRVVYRADDAGVIDENTAEEIVAAVGNRDSIVWVDTDGFRVAPLRQLS